MTDNKDRILFFDFARLLAVLFVIVSHYSYLFNSHFLYTHVLSGSIGRVGVSVFFFMAGSLAYISIKNYGYKKFYIKKTIATLVPYNIVYWSMAIIIFIFPILIDNPTVKYPYFSPIEGLKNGDINFAIILSILGLDGYLLGRFEISSYFFTGEWFIGVVLVLYLLTPLLFKCFSSKPIITSISALILSIVAYILLKEFSNHNVFWSPLVRLFEFTFGFTFIKYFNFFKENIRKLIGFSVIIISIGVIYSLLKGVDLREVLTSAKPYYFIFVIPYFIFLFYLFLLIEKHLNSHKNILRYFASKAYIIILLHHVVINQLSTLIDINNYSLISTLFIMVIVITSIIILSLPISKISTKCTTALSKLFDQDKQNTTFTNSTPYRAP